MQLCNRFSEAESALQLAFEPRLEVPDLLVLRYHLAALKGDKEEMNQVMAGPGQA
jgi:hypothetical protein